jgi:fructosamine-3-kinase
MNLWGGNKGFCQKDGKVVPVIFDPATYFGDRKANVAMTYVFGGFGQDFYDGYNSEWPLPEVRGHRTFLSLFEIHLLNLRSPSLDDRATRGERLSTTYTIL